MNLFNRKPEFDAFISYRRDGSSEFARLLKGELEKHKIKTFLDVDNLQQSYFDEQLLVRIGNAPNFILVLSEGSLDRCADPSDWMRKEIEQALKTNRKIIPVFKQGFRFPDEKLLPGLLKELPRYQSVGYSHEYHEASIQKLVNYVLEKQSQQKKSTENDTISECSKENSDAIQNERSLEKNALKSSEEIITKPLHKSNNYGLFYQWGEKFDQFQSLAMDKGILLEVKESAIASSNDGNYLLNFKGIICIINSSTNPRFFEQLREFVDNGGKAFIAMQNGEKFNDNLIKHFGFMVNHLPILQTEEKDSVFSIDASKIDSVFNGVISAKTRQPDYRPAINKYFKLSNQVKIIRKTEVESVNSENKYTISFEARYSKGQAWFMTDFGTENKLMEVGSCMFEDNNIILADNLKNAEKVVDWLTS